jgi:hypothetical protein
MANNLEKVMAEREAAEHATMHEHRLEAISQIASIGLNTLGAIWIGQHAND